MVSSGDGKCTDEIGQKLGPAMSSNGCGTDEQNSLYIQTSQRGLLDGKKRSNNFLNIFRGLPIRASYMKFGPSPSTKFRQIVEERDAISRSVPSTDQSVPRHFNVPFFRNINWASLRELCKVWIRNPMNMALFVWITCVAVSGAILFLVMTGMLNGALPRKSERETWFEVNNQILNALFTLMCLYQHPKRFHHLVLLLRWRPEDVLRLRKIYCKNGTYKPNEWTHMMVVVVLLHLNCFAQYALCGLNLGYPRSRRPAIGVGICISVAIGAPAFAGVYNIMSPLGRDYVTEIDEEAQCQITSADEIRPVHIRQKTLQKKYSFISKDDSRVAVSKPEWVGGLFNFWEDISVAYLSVFCSCCVFGWNMERLGFGNMYVHIATFLLFCMAPFFIFNLAAININDDIVREALAITGIVLCVFGLLYGGFWRIQMRKKFKLPAYTFCCGNPSVTDCFQWLFCCSCSLAQEVRTADFYDVVEDKLCRKLAGDDDEAATGLALSPLPREDGLALLQTSPGSPYSGKSSPSRFKMEASSMTPSRHSGVHTPERNLPVLEESSMEGRDHTMEPPVVSVVRRE